MYNIQTHRYWTISQLHDHRAEVMARSKMDAGEFPFDMFKKIFDQNLARFWTENPSVVIHIGETCLGIHSFQYLIWYVDISDKDRKEISFFPINFKSREEYREFLEEGVISDKAFGS